MVCSTPYWIVVHLTSTMTAPALRRQPRPWPFPPPVPTIPAAHHLPTVPLHRHDICRLYSAGGGGDHRCSGHSNRRRVTSNTITQRRRRRGCTIGLVKLNISLNQATLLFITTITRYLISRMSRAAPMGWYGAGGHHGHGVGDAVVFRWMNYETTVNLRAHATAHTKLSSDSTKKITMSTRRQYVLS